MDADVGALLTLTPEQVESLSPADQAFVAGVLERQRILSSPAMFAKELSHGLWQPYKHLLYTSEAIVDMVERDGCDVLIIEEPVRHGKTLTCSRWTPAWFITKFRRRALLASYEADFAATHGRAARDIVAEHGPRFGVEIDNRSRAANRWDLIGDDGGMGTAGAGGPITGKGGHLLIVDDPIKNSEDAQSQVMRDKLWEWWQSVFLTRREPGGKVLVIMSRWHEDDLVGRLLSHPDGGMRIRRLRLPAIAEEDDPLGRVPGQALCPERYDEVALSGIRSDVGAGPWASLYQQRPVPAGGGMFKRDWFRYWTSQAGADSTFYRLGEDTIVDAEEVWKFATMDVAYTRTQRSDYTVVATWGVAPTDPPALLLLDVQRKRVEHADHAPLVKRCWTEQKPAWVGIEKQAATLSMFDEVQREGVVVRWLNPDKNKIARAETGAAMAEAGRIYLPKGADWLSDFFDEVLMFPVGKHDDQVDVLAYASAELAKRSVHPRRPRKTEPTDPGERMWARLRERDKHNRNHPVLGKFP